MADKNNGFFDFEDDSRDISSHSESTGRHYEDIVSDSRVARAVGIDFVDFEDYSDKHTFRKKRRGILGAADRFNEWWHTLTAGKKAAFIIGLTVFTLLCLFAIWKWMPLGIRGKTFCSAFGLLALNLLVYAGIRWNRRTVQRVIMVVFTTLLSIVLLITTVFWNPFLKLFYNFDHKFPSNNADLDAVPTIDKNITNIALFGIDTRNEKQFTGNSDSIMILSLNAKEHTVKIISVLRDTLVPIEKDGKTTYNKINSAYARGGAELAVKTLNKIFNLDITDYATVNFYGMAKMIDAVGGIDAELTDREVTARGKNNHGINDMIGEVCQLMGYNANDYYVKRSGQQHLNGIQAVAYSRIRYVPNIWGTNNDYGRTDRQRYVMEQLFTKAITMDKSKYPGLIKTMIPYTVTSLNPDEILSYALNILRDSPTFHQERLPKDGYQMPSPSGSFGSVVYYDLDFGAKLIHSFIYDNLPFDDYVALNGISKNNWYANRGSSGTASQGSGSKTTTTPSQPSGTASTGSSSLSSGSTTTSTESTSSGSSSTGSSSSEDSKPSTPTKPDTGDKDSKPDSGDEKPGDKPSTPENPGENPTDPDQTGGGHD